MGFEVFQNSLQLSNYDLDVGLIKLISTIFHNNLFKCGNTGYDAHPEGVRSNRTKIESGVTMIKRQKPGDDAEIAAG